MNMFDVISMHFTSCSSSC